MPAYNFQAQFAAAVEAGRKLQTVRARRKDGRVPCVGQPAYLYAGMRTKACRRLGVGIVTTVEPVRITCHGDTPEVVLGYCPVDAEEFAADDGFPCARDMTDWFARVHGLPFEGLLIRWTPRP